MPLAVYLLYRYHGELIRSIEKLYANIEPAKALIGGFMKFLIAVVLVMTVAYMVAAIAEEIPQLNNIREYLPAASATFLLLMLINVIIDIVKAVSNRQQNWNRRSSFLLLLT